jgi:hypothetical protein
MTEKFFERALFPRLFQLKCDQRESRKAGSEKSSQGFGGEAPKEQTKNPSVLRTSPFKKGDKDINKRLFNHSNNS